MKLIEKDRLIQAIEASDKKHFDIIAIARLLEQYGDDWYIEGGQLKQCTRSETVNFFGGEVFVNGQSIGKINSGSFNIRRELP